MDIAEQVYTITRNFPPDEVYALTNQIRRSAVSVPSNISEGFGRSTTASFANFIRIARGSLFELETQLLIANRINYIQNPESLLVILDMITEEGKMINTFLKRLENKN